MVDDLIIELFVIVSLHSAQELFHQGMTCTHTPTSTSYDWVRC